VVESFSEEIFVRVNNTHIERLGDMTTMSWKDQKVNIE
jgi:hypothetical protein